VAHHGSPDIINFELPLEKLKTPGQVREKGKLSDPSIQMDFLNIPSLNIYWQGKAQAS
jgi:hypothetical protein